MAFRKGSMLKKSRKSLSRKTSNIYPATPFRARLACPFYAKYPNKFYGVKCSCHGTGFKDNARVVEHLKRTHGPIDEDDAGSSTNSISSESRSSQVKDTVGFEVDRVTHEQLRQINNLPREADVNSKWEKIYQIIFPSDIAIKATYVPSTNMLQEYAQNPPEWLLKILSVRCGVSRSETLVVLNHFLVFFDAVRCRTMVPPSPSLTHQEHTSTGNDSFGDGSQLDFGLGSQSDYNFDALEDGDYLSNGFVGLSGHAENMEIDVDFDLEFASLSQSS